MTFKRAEGSLSNFIKELLQTIILNKKKRRKMKIKSLLITCAS